MAAAEPGACPTTLVSVEISTLGSSTILSAETVMPGLKSLTVAGWLGRLLPALLRILAGHVQMHVRVDMVDP